MKIFFLVVADEISAPTLREFMRLGCYTFIEATPDQNGEVVFEASSGLEEIEG